jgi:hypothetical protein
MDERKMSCRRTEACRQFAASFSFRPSSFLLVCIFLSFAPSWQLFDPFRFFPAASALCRTTDSPPEKQSCHFLSRFGGHPRCSLLHARRLRAHFRAGHYSKLTELVKYLLGFAVQSCRKSLQGNALRFSARAEFANMPIPAPRPPGARNFKRRKQLEKCGRNGTEPFAIHCRAIFRAGTSTGPSACNEPDVNA